MRFFALKGENFNGNQFAKQALEKGAKYAIIDDQSFLQDERYILVDDVLKTLQDLASYHRDYLNLPIIALTGSNGKTTTKELINAVLQTKYHTVATKGNLNNHIGVPLTLLSMNEQTEIGIVEFGANHPNEIAFLANIAKPNYGLITNFGKAHLEGFGNFEGVIKTKTELYQFLYNHNGTAFVNLHDAIQLEHSKSLNKITIGRAEADISIDFLEANPFVTVGYQNHTLHSNMIGSYNFGNIAFAIAIGEYFKIPGNDIIKAISTYKPSNNRSQIIKKGTNTILLDAYNANPSSMKAALTNFDNLESDNKIVFLGDMFELGDFAQNEHQEIVNIVSELSIDKVFLIGENFYQTKTSSDNIVKFKTLQDLINNGNIQTINDSFILIKGSRGMQLERLLEYLN